MTAPLVVDVVRSGTTESSHLVDVAVVDRSGAMASSAGDGAVEAAFRSSSKPIQARVALELGWQPSDERALAIACASHNGEPGHVDAVRAILGGAGIGEDSLLCPPDVPFDPDASLAATARARVFHNCSGKHASMLAACAAAGFPLDDYRAPAHPLQQAVASEMGKRLGTTDGAVLVDGCGVPTFVAPLHALASAFLSIDDGGPEAAAMRAHPFLVGGTGRLDTDLMVAAPHLLCKAGAEGLACVAAGDVGVALKVRDGSARARAPAVIHVLRALGLVDEGVIERVRDHLTPAVLGGGRPVGALHARGNLERR